MSVIQISLTESLSKFQSGIPENITISTNIPCTIFYTTDGTTPTIYSDIYVFPIEVEQNTLMFKLNFFASNGVDTTSVFTSVYQSNFVPNTRFSRNLTNNDPNDYTEDLYPFGTPRDQGTTLFNNVGDGDMTVDDPSKPEISNGFDGSGNPNKFTNKELNQQNYDIVYSTRNKLGQDIRGNAPGRVSFVQEDEAPEQSNTFSNVFDPRAMVIYQDISKENPEKPPIINKQFFSFQDITKFRDGALLFNYALDSQGFTGSFVRSCYNPRDGSVTYYYYDSSANRWLISKAPSQPQGEFDGNLAAVLPARTSGGRYVYKWYPFLSRKLL